MPPLFREKKRFTLLRRVACLTSFVFAWAALSPGIAAAASEIEAVTSRPAGHKRALSLPERQNIFGAQGSPPMAFPGVPTTPTDENAGVPHPWQSQVGGTSTSSLNKTTMQPIVGWSGRGPSIGLSLFHNSRGQTNGIVGTKWTMSYNVYLFAPPQEGPSSEEGPSATNLQLVEGNGAGKTFTANIDGSYSAPPGVHDTLTAAGGGYNLTRKDQSVWHFNAAKFLTSITDRNGNAVTLSYDSNNHLQSVTDAVGRSLTFGWSTDGKHILTITDPTSRVWTLSYSGDNLVSVTEPTLNSASYSTSFGYDSASHVTSITDRRGKVWSFTYTGDGISTETDPLSHTTSYATGTASGVTTSTITDPNNHSVVHKYSTTTGDLVEVDDALNNAETYGYDSDHNKTSATDRRGKVTTLTYDSRGNVLTVTDPLSHVTTFTYDTQNNVLTTTTDLGHVTTNTYDTNGNLDTVTDPLGHQSIFTRNAYGEVTVASDPLYHTKSISYDSYGNPTSVTDELGHTTSSTYDTLGRVITSTNAVGLTSSTAYDAWGRAVSVTAPGSRTSTFGYDAESHRTSVTNALNQTDTFVYDNAGRLVSHTDALNRTVSYGYDNAGNKTSFTDGNGHTTYYSYTNRNQMSGISYPDSTGESYSYYATGELSQRTDGRGVATQYALNDLGQVTGIGYSDGTPAVSFSYDDDNRKTSMTDGIGTTSYGYDNASRLTSRTTPQGTVTFAYDDANRVASRTIPSGTTTLGYDNADRLISASAPGASGTETTTYAYDNANRQVTTTLANGTVETKAYDSGTGDLTGIGRASSSTGPTVTSFAYGYDSLGRKSSETLGGGDSTGYTYDAAGQLTGETRTGGVSYSIGYSYDSAGNRLTKTAGSGTEYYTYDDANKLLTAGTKSYSYDNAGNTTGVYNSATGVTTTLTWDAQERLKTVGNGSFSNTYAYNGLDQRTDKVDSTGTFSYLRAGDGIASPVLSDGAATYNYGAGLVSEVRGGTSKFYQSDALGSTRELTNASGSVTDAHETDAFGSTVAASGSTATPFGFAGQAGYQSDSDTGLKLLGHRYYDSSTGRFISRDPIHDGDNWYIYYENNPIGGTDPTGLSGPPPPGPIPNGPVERPWPGHAEPPYGWPYPGDTKGNPDPNGPRVPAPEDPGRTGPVYPKPPSPPSPDADPNLGAKWRISLAALAVVVVWAFVCCFDGDTPVIMSDGSSKRIDQVHAGDLVLSRDPVTGRTSPKEVVGVSKTHFLGRKLEMSFGNGNRIIVTPNHPMFVTGQGLVPAGRVTSSTKLVMLSKDLSSPRKVEISKFHRDDLVYNLNVRDFHTYFAGSQKLWVGDITLLPTVKTNTTGSN